ncbi:MAG: ADP-ribose-binding protein [Phycisphaerae bacterium]|nr:ADP-ribose-binding protein [Phycisphaerae bacterium]
MIEKTCNLWLERADYRCFLNSGATTGDGEAELETPSALEASKRFTGLALDLGRMLQSRGTHVHLVRPDLIAFPVKQFKWSKPDLKVIARSAQELTELVGDKTTLLPRPGCGQNELTWEEVSPVLASLPDNIIIVNQG